ncbi:hypothetical protein [Plantactinospora sonchi]|uniref:Secreted protein n=1 Tax=Plantactinospora sonchi TaxID=1544735 RepID=A0ABU7RKM0_9ACTN
MNIRMFGNLPSVVVVGAMLVALTGCGGGPNGQAAPTPTTTPPSALDVAQCMRANGHPDFPDPVRDDEGNWTFPDSLRNVPVPEACATLLTDQKAGEQDSALSAEEMAQRRRYSACMRENGVPDFPDPDSDGNFPVSDRLRAMNDSPMMRDARQACREHEPPRVVKPSRSAGA